MKEDKENARPKERRGASAGLGVLLAAGPGTGPAAGTDGRTGAAELDRLERPKDKKETLSKVVIRRLPPSLTKEQLEEHLQPLPDHDYFEFFANDSSLYPHMFSRAYINFRNQEDIVLFRDRFDGYVFVDHKGKSAEYAAIVEFAPFQKAAKKKSKKKDAKTGTIEDDPEYKKFLESYSADDEKLTSTPETLLEEIEARNKELIAKKTTPLLNFLKNKQRLREEKREERRRRELERKRQREEERRKWKEEERRKRKEAEKLKKVDRCPEKERDRSKEEPKIKLLKKPEKDEKDMERKEKFKKLEKDTLREEKNASSASAKRSDGETKEEKAKKSEDECVKDYRDRDRDFDREREYERAQREKLRRQEEERRRQKERYEKEKVYRRKEEEVKKERDLLREKGKKSDLTDFTSSTDKFEKVTKDDKKEDTIKRDRIRNKDRPAMQLYQPGARSRSRLCQYEDSTAKLSDQGVDKKQGGETSHMKEEE
ncbi:REN3B protein, partial [Spelaeornis formosus]|nr:REN3B protein [Elachura formosa]